MSQKQEERREGAQAERHDRLYSESQPLRDRIAVLKAEIADLEKQISDIYSPYEEFLTKP
ncbi:hypothetical protein ABNM01_11005 [Pseudomonas syringae]